MARQRRQHEHASKTDRPKTERAPGEGAVDRVEVGDRVRAKTTARTGEVTHVKQDGDHQQLTVSYDHQPQDEYLTTPAREGTELPRELVVPVDDDGEPSRPA